MVQKLLSAEQDRALFEMELKIARCADRHARELHRTSSLNLVCWLMAEAEQLGSRVGSDAGLPNASAPSSFA
jgi:hypothetical protein